MRAALGLTALTLLLLGGCTPDGSAFEAFRRDVVPVLEQRCASTTCHGVALDAEAAGQSIDPAQLSFRVDGAGHIVDLEEAYRTAKRAIDTVEDPEFSSLLRKPLALALGGVPHLGGHAFWSKTDPAFLAVRRWIGAERGGGEDPAPLTPEEQLFARTVQPVLVEASCLTPRCHGDASGGTPFRLDGGYAGKFPISATRHNHEQALAAVSLDGPPRLSRLLRKSLPLGVGIVHKGGNGDPFAGNPGSPLAAIEAWICAEQARVGLACDRSTGDVRGFVYVRGPAPAVRHVFDLDTFHPGTDLFYASLPTKGPGENLTAKLHPDGPADIRDPAVSRDGRRVAFAMRTKPGEGHRIWVLDLATREARPLTSGPADGARFTDRDPTFGPDDGVWFASTRAGTVAARGILPDAELWSADKAGLLRRWTFTPHVERKPVFFDLGHEAGRQLSFSALRDGVPGRERAHVFRFPLDLSTEYHQHFGITPKQTLHFDMRELPDGRYVGVTSDLPAIFQGGSLSVIDRNLGPEINEGSVSKVAALESYVAPMTILTGDGFYRDPAPLPDGRILVAHQPGPFDGTDPGAAFAPRIELLTLEERPDGSGPRIAHSEVLLVEPGVALTDPEPVVLRAPVRAAAAPPVDPTPDALFRHQGLPMIDGLLQNLAPSGVKVPNAEIAWVRLIEHLPMTPADRISTPLADHPDASTTGFGPQGPARILAELPLAADGSFYARVPAGAAFRVQALDAARMAIGAHHDRWFYALGGQVLNQGISASSGTGRYGASCAACHGNADGTAGPANMESPDLLTGASLTASRFARQHPRHPLPPVSTGPATRISVDFTRDVQPLLERRCVRCHGVSSAGGLDLRATPIGAVSVAYASLLQAGWGSGGGRRYVDASTGRARNSFLVEWVLGRELDAPRPLPLPLTPHPADGPLSAEEVLTLVRWIDLGATFVGGPS